MVQWIHGQRIYSDYKKCIYNDCITVIVTLTAHIGSALRLVKYVAYFDEFASCQRTASIAGSVDRDIDSKSMGRLIFGASLGASAKFGLGGLWDVRVNGMWDLVRDRGARNSRFRQEHGSIRNGCREHLEEAENILILVPCLHSREEWIERLTPESTRILYFWFLAESPEDVAGDWLMAENARQRLRTLNPCFLVVQPDCQESSEQAAKNARQRLSTLDLLVLLDSDASGFGAGSGSQT